MIKSKLIKIDIVNKKHWLKKDIKPYNLNCPNVAVSDEGTQVLFVIDFVPKEDLMDSNKVLMGGETGIVLGNMIDYVIANKDVKVKDYMILNFNAFKTLNMPESDRIKAERDFIKRIMAVANKYNPDTICFFGYDPIKYLEIEGKYDPVKDIGRIYNLKYKNKKYKFLYTLSMQVYGTTDSRKFGKLPNLIGVGVDHIETAFRSKNLYNIQKEVDATPIVYIDNIQKFKSFYKSLVNSSIVTCDTETRSLYRMNNEIQTIQFFLEKTKESYLIPLYHKDSPFSGKELNYIVKWLKHYFEMKSSKYIIFHNAKFDIIRIRISLGVRFVNHRLYDTMAGKFSLDENNKFFSDMGRINGEKYSAYSLEKLEHEYGYIRPETSTNKENRGSIADRPLKDSIEYACIDVISIYYIHLCQIDTAKRRGSKYNKFLKVVTEQISDMIHVFADMEINGTDVDKEYLLLARAKTSELRKQLHEINDKFKNSKAAQKANKIILRSKGAPAKGLFGQESWVFKISKPKHREILYYDVLKLKPVSFGVTGLPKTDKTFQKEYKDKVEEVQLLEDYNKVSKLINTYIDGIWKQLTSEPDFKFDNKLRATYVFLGILTGRCGASKPGFQQIPSRGKLAKLIKRQFIARIYEILIEKDYSAHEVRVWGNRSKDEKISSAFRKGLRARQRLRIATSKASLKVIQSLKKDIEVDGDIHAINHEFFFKRRPKDKNERNSIKAVVFGVIYGKGKKSLGKDLSEAEKVEFTDNHEKQAGKLIDKLFAKFKNGGDWIKKTIKDANEEKVTVSRIGRVRHLWGYLHHDRGVIAAMNRRGPNSDIQGTASDIGMQAGRQLQILIWELFVKQGQDFSYKHMNAVHDSNKGKSHIVESPIALYLKEHALTTRVHKKLREVFNFQGLVDYETEGELGPAQSELIKWDYSIYNTEESNKTLDKPEDGGVGLLPIIKSTIDWQIKELEYAYTETEVRDMLRIVEHNSRILEIIRRKELQMSINDDKPSEVMLIKPENSLKLGLIFANNFTDGSYKSILKKYKDVNPLKLLGEIK